MKQVLLRQGTAVVEEVPAPMVEPGTLLIAVKNSCISSGTELSGMTMSGEPLWKRALKQPENVKKVLQMVASSGISRTKSMVQGHLSAGVPTGYSAAGEVIAVGEGINEIQIGKRMACAGAQYANHAEIICVPINLCVPIDDAVSFEEASTVTLGAIALQGVRRLQPSLGETFVVFGLGLLGQITGQILRANGCRVIGIDVDPQRIEVAKLLGMDMAVSPDELQSVEQVCRLTHGVGADGVIITAAAPSSQPLSTAFNMCRKKGRVVLVGDVGLDIKRADIYAKELDFLISCSYGPGRYDFRYEELGLDYPVGYVRWTENRNMCEYLHMIAEKKIQLSPLIQKIFPISEAFSAYEFIKNGQPRPFTVLLSYPGHQRILNGPVMIDPRTSKSARPKVGLALVGAGGFAKGMHLPNLQKLKEFYDLQAIVSRNGANAIATAKQFNAKYATTDYTDLFKDQQIDALLIATRHVHHAAMSLQALRAGKHVLVEKPLCLTLSELKLFQQFFDEIGKSSPVLLVGFNRRFSPYLEQIFNIIKERTNPMIINYRMNAGHIPLDHWVHGEQGGGRNIGEACHIYDLFTFLTQSKVTSVVAHAIEPKTEFYAKNDNFIVTLKFADGSIATLIYTALGHKQFPKEKMEIFVDGKVLHLDDYKSLEITGLKVKSKRHQLPQKGQAEELKAFAQTILKGGDWPIPLWQIFQSSEISFAVESQLQCSFTSSYDSRTACAVL